MMFFQQVLLTHHPIPFHKPPKQERALVPGMGGIGLFGMGRGGGSSFVLCDACLYAYMGFAVGFGLGIGIFALGRLIYTKAKKIPFTNRKKLKSNLLQQKLTKLKTRVLKILNPQKTNGIFDLIRRRKLTIGQIFAKKHVTETIRKAIGKVMKSGSGRKLLVELRAEPERKGRKLGKTEWIAFGVGAVLGFVLGNVVGYFIWVYSSSGHLARKTTDMVSRQLKKAGVQTDPAVLNAYFGCQKTLSCPPNDSCNSDGAGCDIPACVYKGSCRPLSCSGHGNSCLQYSCRDGHCVPPACAVNGSCSRPSRQLKVMFSQALKLAPNVFFTQTLLKPTFRILRNQLLHNQRVDVHALSAALRRHLKVGQKMPSGAIKFFKALYRVVPVDKKPELFRQLEKSHKECVAKKFTFI